jgi:hypothetical protein
VTVLHTARYVLLALLLLFALCVAAASRNKG